MLYKPDCWLAEKYDKSFGSQPQWAALRRLYKDEALSEKDEEWLQATGAHEVDGNMEELLATWKSEHLSDGKEIQVMPVETISQFPAALNTTVNDLLTEIRADIQGIRLGTLTDTQSREIAKHRELQLRSMALLLDAANLEAKLRLQANNRGRE